MPGSRSKTPKRTESTSPSGRRLQSDDPQAELRKVLGALGARVLDVELAVPHAHERFDQFGRLTDGNFLEQLTAVVDSIVLAVAERAARIEVIA